MNSTIDTAERADFIRLIPASHEAIAKLDRYAALLIEWSQKFNLVSPSTLPHVWSRHFLNSAQLVPLIPKRPDRQLIADLGSGAGFPGLVLSIMGVPDVHLIESTGKKADFLRAVITELELDTEVHQARVEDMLEFRAEIITARALAPLTELLPLAMPLMRKDTICLFLKGQNADVELIEAHKHWTFDCAKTQSLSDPSGNILTISNVIKPSSDKKVAGRTAKRVKK